MTLAFSPETLTLDTRHYLGGRRVVGHGQLPVIRPSDGVTTAMLPVADASVVDEAVCAAHQALEQSGWGRAIPRDRTRAMHRWADLIEQHAAELARLEAVVSTRPVDELPTGDIAITAEQIRFFAELADKEGGAVVPTRDESLGMILDAPIGVIGAITPWNFPLSMAGWKIGPALAAGNAIVLKPSEMTPFATLRMAELAVEAGIPAGLISILLGDGPTTGAALVAHPGIGKVSFTGSTRAGSNIAANLAATGLKPMTLELGGKSPQVVLADADIDLAARSIARSILFNSGQACVAGSRVIVAKRVADALAEKLIGLMSNPRIAPTWGAGAGAYPIISSGQIGRIDSIVQAARNAGAAVLAGGTPMQAEGYFYAPTILATQDPDNPAVREEIFGPVLTLETFVEEDEATSMANSSVYGLCAGLYTRDLSRAMRLTQKLEAGTVWVNRYGRSRDHILPTGGWKQSGLGHDLGREAYRACRRSKSVLIDL